MNSHASNNIFPEKISVDDVLKLIEEKMYECNCPLKEAFEILIQERLQDKN